jgi:hypothetical protein
MIQYIPAASAEALSEALYALSRPPGVRHEKDTRFLFGRRLDKTRAKLIEVDDAEVIYIHPQAELNGIADILEPFILAKVLPANTNAALADYVNLHRGEQVLLWDVIPDYFKGLAKDERRMISEGLLNEPGVLP